MDGSTKLENSTQSATPARNRPGPIDMHVHMVGNGSSGSGCWLRFPPWHFPLASLMVREIGLKGRDFKGDFDTLYVERLLEFTRNSSLQAVVILGHDLVYDASGKEIPRFSSFFVPNDYVLKLAGENPEFLAAVSIHPARPDALDELEKCVEQGAVLMKILPNCHNIDCNLPRYRKFWERMAGLNLPLLAHTGGEHTVPVFSKAYSNPAVLKLPLECGVKVIAAHSGTKSGLLDPDYFRSFVQMTGRYPNLFGDTSAFNVPIRGRHIPECLQAPLVDRMVHGSDFPVPSHGHFGWMKGWLRWDDFRRWEKHPNPLERDYQIKKAIGFPEAVFSRVHEILRLPKAKVAATK